MKTIDREKMDLEFFKAFKKDKTLTRAEFNKSYSEKLLNSANKKTVTKNRFDITAPSETHKKLYKALEQYCAKFPNVNPKNLLLWGATGTGKTFATQIIKDTLNDRKIQVEFTTAFGMVKEFQKYVNSFGREDERINDFLDCDLLIIDDLGSEPIIKNVTSEHIYNVINERLTNEKAFIITTNLSPDEIMRKYDQRIASRILALNTTTIIELTGKDLR